MRALTAEAVLGVWERAQGRSPTVTALLSLAAARPESDWPEADWPERTWPERTWDQLAGLPLGERDRRLLRLRRATFGETLESRVDCPRCGELLEFALHTDQLLGLETPSEPVATPDSSTDDVTRPFERDDLVIELRPLASADLLAVEGRLEGAETARVLARRALVSATRSGQPIDFDALDDDELQWFEERLLEVDPEAERLLNLRCPDCDHTWSAPFDIAAFLDAEIGFEAERLLAQIHTLARFYGWAEHHILAMSARRRQAYLERIAD